MMIRICSLQFKGSLSTLADLGYIQKKSTITAGLRHEQTEDSLYYYKFLVLFYYLSSSCPKTVEPPILIIIVAVYYND